MKKRLLISALCIALTGVAYASSSHECDVTKNLVANLNLDDARALEVEQILSSYKQVKDLAKSGRYEDIPLLIEDMNVQLSQVLVDEELQQFQENVGNWAESMDFSEFKKYAGKSHDQNR